MSIADSGRPPLTPGGDRPTRGSDGSLASSLTWRLGGDLTLRRLGYGAMQLTGPGVWGPPRDPDAARAVLRRAVELGVNHIDTSDYYGPHVVNDLIRETLSPYPDDLVIGTKVGARRDERKGWPTALSADELRGAVHDNLRRLGLQRLDIVNLRVGGFEDPVEGSIAEPFSVLAELREEGLIRHLGVSNVTATQLAEARSIAPVACVQNHFNIARRGDSALVDACAADGLAYVSFFPLGGIHPVHGKTLGEVGARHGATGAQVALAWLLQRSPALLLIPGTSSVEHLEENLAAAGLDLTAGDLADLVRIGG